MATIRCRIESPIAGHKDARAITVRWAAHDDNGDDLIYSLYLRGDGETCLAAAQRQDYRQGLQLRCHADSRRRLSDQGGGSDAPSHTPGDALQAKRSATGSRWTPRRRP